MREEPDSFQIVEGAGAGTCATNAAAAPDAPRFEAGTVDPSAGIYSPFILKLARADGSAPLRSIDTTLPAGLLARLTGVVPCPDAALAAAAAKSGRSEQASPELPGGFPSRLAERRRRRRPDPAQPARRRLPRRPLPWRSAQPRDS